MMGSCAALAMERRLSLASRASAAYSTDGITINPCTPIAWACSAKRQALRVRVSLTLTSTGTRPSATASAVLATASFSSKDSVLASPSEPQVSSACTPLSIWNAKWRSISAKSRSSFSLNLVVTAGKTPAHFSTAMLFSWRGETDQSNGGVIACGGDAARARRHDGCAHGIGSPAIQHAGGSTADAALARPHAAARLQFGAAPAVVLSQLAVRDVFAAADDGVVVGQRAQFGARREGVRQPSRETAPALAVLDGGQRQGTLSGGRQAGDAALRQRQVDAADAAAFAGAKDIVDGAALQFIDADRQAVERAAERQRQLHVGQQAVAAGQQIAGDGCGFCATLQPYRAQRVVAVRGQHITVGEIGHAA